MKILFDFLPIILFFGAFKYAGAQKEWASSFATEHFGFLVSGGTVGPAEAPVLLATMVVIVASLAQIGWLLARKRKVDLMLWISLALVVVLGGATIWFHSETFIKWKPSVLYWVMGGSLAISQIVFRKNLLKALMGEQLQLPEPVWQRLTYAWCGFFAFMGLLNLYVAYNYSTDAWVDFKLFGGIGLMVLFTLAQGFYLSRHMHDGESPANLPVNKP